MTQYTNGPTAVIEDLKDELAFVRSERDRLLEGNKQVGADLQAARDHLNEERSLYIERGKALGRRERALTEALRDAQALREALVQIADPEVFDADWRAMRATARKALSQDTE